MQAMKKHLILFLAVAAVLTAMLSCGHRQPNAQKLSNADSLIDAAFDARDYERVLALCE